MSTIPQSKIVIRKKQYSKVKCDTCGKIKRIRNMGMFKGKILCSSCKPHIVSFGSGRKISRDYDREYDIFYCNFGGDVEHSMEMFDGNLILDYNKTGDVVGFEIMDFKKQFDLSKEKTDKLFKKK